MSDTHGRTKAVVKTTLIVVIVLGLAFVFSLLLTRRLISTWQPEPQAAPPASVAP